MEYTMGDVQRDISIHAPREGSDRVMLDDRYTVVDHFYPRSP